MSFTFNTTPKIYFKAGGIADLNVQFPAKHLFIVTDKGMAKAGLLLKLMDALGTAAYTIYDAVEADPSEAIVLDAVDLAKTVKATHVLGFGGGSPMDVAKLVALLARSSEKLSDIYGINNVKGARLPLALMPTTSGTGSEVTPIAIITTGKTTKMGVVSPVLLPDLALLDPELTYDLPAGIAAPTGIDAMVHAIEAYTSKGVNNNPISKSLALEALRLMGQAFLKALAGDKQSRADMMLGSLLAGQAFANSPVAAVHALAYPLGGHYKLPHGLTNALVLPHVIAFNESVCGEDYKKLNQILFSNSMNFADNFTHLAAKAGLKSRLRDYNIPEADLGMLANDAMKQTRLLVNNPRDVSEADALAIYKAAY